VTLAYSRTIPVAVYCGSGTNADASADASSDAIPEATTDASADAAVEASTISMDAGSCANRPHPFDGTSWTVAVTGSGATVTPKGSPAWTCTATGPQASPGSGPDGSPVPATGCYLLVSCGRQTAGDAGASDVQIQILAQSTTDVLVLAHDDTGSCCSDEYTGSWH